MLRYVLILMFAASAILHSTGVPDGIYSVVNTYKVDEDRETSTNNVLINYNPKYSDEEKGEQTYVEIDPSDYVPLVLAKAPVAKDDENGRKKVFLSFGEENAKKLAHFSAKHLNTKVCVVIDGEAVSMHEVKSILETGVMQITRCTDDGCKYLFEDLKDNVKP